MMRDAPATCSACGVKIETYRAAGKVENDEFVVSHRYCDSCYESLGKFLDEVA